MNIPASEELSDTDKLIAIADIMKSGPRVLLYDINQVKPGHKYRSGRFRNNIPQLIADFLLLYFKLFLGEYFEF